MQCAQIAVTLASLEKAIRLRLTMKFGGLSKHQLRCVPSTFIKEKHRISGKACYPGTLEACSKVPVS